MGGVLIILTLPIAIMYGIYLITDLIEFRNLLKKIYINTLGEVISREYHHSRYSISISYTIKFFDVYKNEYIKTTQKYVMGEKNPEIFREHEKVEIIYFEDSDYIFFNKNDLKNQLKNKLYNIIVFIITLIYIIYILIFIKNH